MADDRSGKVTYRMVGMPDLSSLPEPESGQLGRPRIGDWNHLESFIGARGHGKSTLACARAMELYLYAGGAYVIGHSLGSRLPERLPADLGGHELPIVYHSTIAQLDRGLRRDPEKWHILAPPMIGDGVRVPAGYVPESADDLLQYSIRLSAAIRRDAWKREHLFGAWNPPKTNANGIPCVPVIVLIDEGIAVEAASVGQRSRQSDRWFLEFLFSLRHNHVALLYSIQEPTSRSWRVLEQSTQIHVFQIKHRWALEAIRAAGANDPQIVQIQTLDRFQYVTLE